MEENIPKHIAIIMDGNRTWAKERGMIASQGHKAGAKVLENVLEYASKRGIKYITVYAFSTEHWKRSKKEVGLLMDLFKTYLDNYSKEACENNMRVRVIGTREGLDKTLIQSIDKCEELTINCTGLTLNIALNYGGREEIITAIKNIAKDVREGILDVGDITEDVISDNLYTKDVPEPDLVIRTSGQIRISNFLLWQIAYSELLFIDKCWPDFTNDDLDRAICEYQKRKRNFGAN